MALCTALRTRMTSVLLAVLATSVFGSQAAFSEGVAQASSDRIQEIVKGLGLNGAAVSGDFDTLATNPRFAVRMLIDQLHPIARKAYYPDHKTADSQHVIACLRALRYLTGVTFSAPTEEKLTDDEKQFLDFKHEMHDANPEHKIHFFGVWMSRNAEFVAPPDVQKKIIDLWRKWCHDHGATFQRSMPKAKDCMDDWFWFG